jgi:hypothetical protein
MAKTLLNLHKSDAAKHLPSGGANGQAIIMTAGSPAWGSVASNFADLGNKPTTIAGYGITNGVTLSGAETLLNKTLQQPMISGGYIGDGSGYELIKFTSVANAANEITVETVATGGTPKILASGSDANVSLNLVPKGTGTIQVGGVEVATISGTQTLSNKTLTAPKFADTGYIADSSSNELIKFSLTTSAVNEITVKNAATANAPQIQATGGDANVSLNLVPKGTGTVQISGVDVVTTSGTQFLSNKQLNFPKIGDGGYIADNNGCKQIKFSTAVSAVNEITVKNAATASGPEIQATGTDTNIDLNLIPKGTGKVKMGGTALKTITQGTAAPSGGSDGDVYLQYS